MSINGDRDTPPHGFMPTLKVVGAKVTQHDSDITALRENAKTIASSVIELETWRGEVMGEFGKVHTEIAELSTDVRAAVKLATIRPPPLPPMRAELDSKLDVTAIIQAAAAAALEGQARPDSTPEAEVEKIVLQVSERRQAAEIVKASEKRQKLLEKVLVGLLLVIASAIAGHYWR